MLSVRGKEAVSKLPTLASLEEDEYWIASILNYIGEEDITLFSSKENEMDNSLMKIKEELTKKEGAGDEKIKEAYNTMLTNLAGAALQMIQAKHEKTHFVSLRKSNNASGYLTLLDTTKKSLESSSQVTFEDIHRLLAQEASAKRTFIQEYIIDEKKTLTQLTRKFNYQKSKIDDLIKTDESIKNRLSAIVEFNKEKKNYQHLLRLFTSLTSLNDTQDITENIPPLLRKDYTIEMPSLIPEEPPGLTYLRKLTDQNTMLEALIAHQDAMINTLQTKTQELNEKYPVQRFPHPETQKRSMLEAIADDIAKIKGQRKAQEEYLSSLEKKHTKDEIAYTELKDQEEEIEKEIKPLKQQLSVSRNNLPQLEEKKAFLQKSYQKIPIMAFVNKSDEIGTQLQVLRFNVTDQTLKDTLKALRFRASELGPQTTHTAGHQFIKDLMDALRFVPENFTPIKQKLTQICQDPREEENLRKEENQRLMDINIKISQEEEKIPQLESALFRLEAKLEAHRAGQAGAANILNNLNHNIIKEKNELAEYINREQKQEDARNILTQEKSLLHLPAILTHSSPLPLSTPLPAVPSPPPEPASAAQGTIIAQALPTVPIELSSNLRLFDTPMHPPRADLSQDARSLDTQAHPSHAELVRDARRLDTLAPLASIGLAGDTQRFEAQAPLSSGEQGHEDTSPETTAPADPQDASPISKIGI